LTQQFTLLGFYFRPDIVKLRFIKNNLNKINLILDKIKKMSIILFRSLNRDLILEVNMYHINYRLVKSIHEAQQNDISRMIEQDALAKMVKDCSPSIAGRAADRLGDGLILLGEKLRNGNSSKPAALLPTYDCD
jgi:hypothetical protein